MSESIIRRYRIPISGAITILLLSLAKPSPTLFLTGLPLVLAGVGLRTWSSGHIRKNQALAVGGPYAITRNPLYLGSFLIGAGLGVMANRPFLLILFLVSFWAVFRAVISEEEAFLRAAFSEEFREYSARVPRFFPRMLEWKRHPKPADETFQWALVIKHREYYTWMGALAGIGWLIWRLKV
jgi:protein-S-isoprenylcysteine O-methyltransferase Ste14